MFYSIWESFLFLPLVNVLMYLYATIAFQNYALAIAELVIIMRVFLLPLTFTAERNKSKYHKLAVELKKIEAKHTYDTVSKNQLIRQAMKTNKIKPMAKVISLAIQGFVLLLFYAVNLKAIDNLDKLYGFVPEIRSVDTNLFAYFDMLQPSWLLAGVCAIYLFVKILIDHAGRKETLTEGDRFYRYVFPLFTFVFLGLIPSAKSIFVFTSMFFSTIIHRSRQLYEMANPNAVQVTLDIDEVDKKNNEPFSGSPWDQLKK